MSIIQKEFQGNVFKFREDGYFNVTAAAKVFGKRLDNFMSAPDTQEYITQFTKFLESNSLNFSEFSSSPKIIETTMGRNGGTWAHPKLAVFFARWLDVSFAVWCDMVIDDLLNKKAVLSIQKPEESMALKVPQSLPEALRLAADLAEQNEKIQAKLDVAEKELNFLTVDEYRALTHRYMNHGEKVRLGQKAAKIMDDLGLRIEKQFRTIRTHNGNREVPVNVYPRYVLEKAEAI